MALFINPIDKAGKALYDLIIENKIEELAAECDKIIANNNHDYNEILNWATKDELKETLLHAALECPECMAILLKTPGLDVNKTDADDITPLWLAAHRGMPDIVKLLLNSKFNPPLELDKAPRSSKQYYSKMTPLQIAQLGFMKTKSRRDLLNFLETRQERDQRVSGCKEVFKLLLIASEAGSTLTNVDNLSKSDYESSELYDFIEGNDIPLRDFLKEPENIIFRMGKIYYGYNKNQLRDVELLFDQLLYMCPNVGSMENIDTTKIYYKLRQFGIAGGVIPYNQLKSCIESEKERIFDIVETNPKIDLPSTISLNVHYQITRNAYVSAAHCQDGQEQTVYEVKILNVSQSGGRKKKSKSSTKKYKRNKTKRNKNKN